jgi:transposase-like protein
MSNEKTSKITPELREQIINEVKNRKDGESVKDVMVRHGRTVQTYYFWMRKAAASVAKPAKQPVMATKRAKSQPVRAKAKSDKSTDLQGVLMPEGRPVRIHTTGTEWAIVTFE